MGQLTFDFIDEIVPIPECSGLMAMSGYKTPQALADEWYGKQGFGRSVIRVKRDGDNNIGLERIY